MGDYTPIFLSDIPRLFSSGQLPLDTALIQVSPPDERGMCSFGISVDIVRSAAANSTVVIAQVNPRMPRTLGDSFIHIHNIDFLVPVDVPLIEVQWAEQTDVTRSIGEYVAALVDDGVRARDFSGVERILALKARQLGITWLLLGLLLYLGSFWGHRLFLIVSQSGDDAQAAMHRLKIMHDSLPEKWRRPMVKDNTRELEFDNGSRYESGMATKRYGRSKAAFAALADEVDFWDWPADQMDSLEPACHILWAASTADGPDGYLHSVWREAAAKRGRWLPVFLPWTARPDRDPAWYRANVTEATEPRRARRQYPATPEEAFAAPEGIFFERFDSKRNAAEVTVVENYDTVRAVDFGYHHPACVWIQSAPSGQPFVVAELVPHDRTTEEFIADIRAIDARLGLVMPPHFTYCDPAGNAVNVQTAQSEVAALRAAGMAPISRPSSIRDGCVRLIGLLSDPDLPLVVSRSCPWTIEALAGVRPDKHRPDVYDETSEYCHVLDALRYWAVNAGERGQRVVRGSRVAGGSRPVSGIAQRRF